MDGDGVAEFVPKEDKVGPEAPSHAYSLFTGPEPPKPVEPSQRFSLGGNIYSSWAQVPDRYKQFNSQNPDPRRSTASVFTFSWQ